MSEIIKRDIYRLLEFIITTCFEIQHQLENELTKALDEHTKEGWQKDIVTINNILSIANTVKYDIDSSMISKCMELTLRRAVQEQKKELKKIPLKKNFHAKIIDAFKEIHEIILRITE